MNSMKKVIWAEGICLSQQHLQQWEHYYQQQQDCQWQWHYPHAWGIHQLDISTESLRLGVLVVSRLEAVMADGFVLRYVSSQDDALNYDLKALEQQEIEVFVGLPLTQCAQGIPGYAEPNLPARWQVQPAMVADEYDPQRERELMLAQVRPVLLTQQDPLELYSLLPLAKVRRDSQGQWQWIAGYVPPLLNIHSHPWLLQQLNRVKQELGLLLDQLLQANSHDVLALLQIASDLKQLLQLQPCHPHACYQLLLHLFHALTKAQQGTIVLDWCYNHQQLSAGFIALLQPILKMLQQPLPQAWQCWYLVEENFIFVAEQILFRDDKYYLLEVHYGAIKSEQAAMFDQYSKIAARSQIQQLMSSALSGLSCERFQPQQLPFKPKANCDYWCLRPGPEFWQCMQQENSIAVFVPSHLAVQAIALIQLGA